LKVRLESTLQKTRRRMGIQRYAVSKHYKVWDPCREVSTSKMRTRFFESDR
jgi:hypothetical protein